MKKILTVAALTCAMLLGGCGAVNDTDTSQVVFTIGDEQVTENEFRFYYDTYKQNMDLGAAKEISLEYSENDRKILAVAKAKGIELDDEDKKELESQMDSVKENYDSDGGYDEFLKQSNITNSYVEKLVSIPIYKENLQELMGDKEYTDEEKREFFKNNYRRAKHILISTVNNETGEELSEEEQAAAKTKAEELLERAKNGEDFDALVKEFSEDPGSETYPDGYVFTDNDMVIEFQDGVDSIQPGEFTLVKSTYGYHVIQRLPLDETYEGFETEYNNVKDSLDSAMEEEDFNNQLDIWAQENSIEFVINQEVYDSIQ